MRVLIIAPYFSRPTPGESWSTYKWVEGISAQHETTVLTTHKPTWDSTQSPVRAKEMVNWPDPFLPKALARIDWELKPGYFLFYRRARKWIQNQLRQGRKWDIAHQINPLAMRYPSPLRKLGIPYVIGPLAGSLPTPEGFRGEGADRQWFRKLRNLDKIRLSVDPWLRSTYADASAVLGVAPYVAEHLGSDLIKHFVSVPETGVESVTEVVKGSPAGRPLRLLFVGRLIRTKGITDAIRAVIPIARSGKIEFNILGAGDLESECRRLIDESGTTNAIRLHGRLPREQVNDWYRYSDVFLFPSFREPSGNVVFEAMSHGLPVIGCNLGGPAHIITDASGWRLGASTPAKLVTEIHETVSKLIDTPDQIPERSLAAIRRVKEVAYWPSKIDNLSSLYHSVTTR